MASSKTPISPEMRARLNDRLRKLSTGAIIDNKSFTSANFHFCTFDDAETPGLEVEQYFSESLNFGVTSPRTLGLKDPIFDFLESVKDDGVTDMEAVKKIVRANSDYWMLVIPMGDPGTAEAPNLKIFRATKTIFTAVVKRMLDPDHSEDITDLVSGWTVKVEKVVKQGKTTWVHEFMDRQPVGEEQDFIDAVQAAIDAFNMRAHRFRVDWEKLEKIYKALTGESVPKEYLSQDPNAQPEPAPPVTAKTLVKPAAAPAKTLVKPAPVAAAKPAPAKPAPATPKKPTPAPVVEQPAVEEQTAPEPDANGVILGVTRVSFVDGEEAKTGTVMSVDDGGDYLITDPDGVDWALGFGDMTILPEEGAETQDTEASTAAETGAAEETAEAERVAAEEAAKAAAATAKPKPKPTPAGSSLKAALRNSK